MSVYEYIFPSMNELWPWKTMYWKQEDFLLGWEIMCTYESTDVGMGSLVPLWCSPYGYADTETPKKSRVRLGTSLKNMFLYIVVMNYM